MQYTRGKLSKICSWLYRNERSNPARIEIYQAISSKLHPRCEIKAHFSEETEKVIQRVGKIVETLYSGQNIKTKKSRKK